MSKMREFFTNVVRPAKATADLRAPAADASPSNGKGADQSLIDFPVGATFGATAAKVHENDTFAVQWNSFNHGKGKSPAFTDLLIIRKGKDGPEVFNKKFREAPLEPGQGRLMTSGKIVAFPAGEYFMFVTLAEPSNKTNFSELEIDEPNSSPVDSSGGDGAEGEDADSEGDQGEGDQSQGAQGEGDQGQGAESSDSDGAQEESEVFVDEDGGLSPNFRDLTRFDGGAAASSSAEGTGAENAPATNEVAPATDASVAGVLPLLVGAAEAAAPVAAGAAGAAGVGAAIIIGGPLVVGAAIVAGVVLTASADERADRIDDEGPNEGGVPDSGFDGGVPPTVPRNPEDERTPPTQPNPETGTPDEALPPTQPTPRLNPEDERSPETLPSPGQGFPPAPLGAVEAEPSVIDRGVEAIQSVFQGSDGED